MTTSIRGANFAEMIFCASAALTENRQKLNDLNVFPVPDGDTGTNMSMTMSAAANTLRAHAPATVTEAADAAASAMLRGARGNSGVILSLLFRGISKSLKGKETATTADWARALADGVDAAYSAVMKPAEGTVLTVSRLAAERAVKLVKGGTETMEELLEGALETAREALADTVNQNPVLKKAGVVDAGGQGYVFITEAMLRCLEGTFTSSSAAPAEAAPVREAATFGDIRDEDITFTYCTEFIVAREHDRDPALLRSFLDSIGDSLVLVDDDDIIKVHVHTDAPGRALTEGLLYGPLQTVKIENMRNQHTQMIELETAPEKEAPVPAEKPVGFVAVCAGEGMAELFRSLGADRIVTGGQTMNPSTEDILREVNRTPAETVFVLPNNKNIIMAAQQCDPLTEKEVVVVPTVTVPQGVSAMAGVDPSADPAALPDMMWECAQRVHTAQITYAARDSEFDGQTIHAGEYLGLMDGRLLGSTPDLGELLPLIKNALSALSPEFLTVYYGADVTEGDAQSTADSLAADFPDADISVISGGQPVYYYMISAE